MSEEELSGAAAATTPSGAATASGASTVSRAPQPLSVVTLQGRQVRLEPLALEHVPALLAIAQGPRDTFQLTTVPPEEEGMRSYVAAALAARDKGAALPFATVDLRSGSVVGSTRFGNIEYWDWPDGKRRRPERCPEAVEIGWTWLAPAAQRSAVNSEAKLLMLGHAFEVLRVHRVTLKTDARNTRSRNAIARLGAKLDGILRCHSPAAQGDGPRDAAVFSILAAEWPALKARLQERLERGQV